MARKIKRIVTILGLALLLGMALQCVLFIKSIRIRSDKKCTVTAPAASTSAAARNILSNITKKEFIYLVQTESCLPLYIAEPERLGNASACRCDVLVLSYKNKCEKVTNSHVEYIYAPNTTWASGRNLLYRTSRGREFDYHYYIFADDDIKLKYNSFANKSVTTQPELRTFENFLLDIEPAVGFVDYAIHHPASLIRAMRQHCLNKPDLSLLPLVHFDPILNGFHRDAISHLLPYSEEFDSTCWWHSHRLVTIGIEVKFRGQAVMYSGLTVQNLSHRKYPANASDEIQVIKKAIEREKAHVPIEYQNHFSLLFFTFQPYHYSWGLSPTTCNDILPHRPIVPYAHFKEFPMHNYNTLERFFNITAVMPVFYNWIRTARSG